MDVVSLTNLFTNHAEAYVKPTHDYFYKKMNEDLEVAVLAFKFAQYFSQARVVDCSQHLVIIISLFSLFGVPPLTSLTN